MSRGINPDSIPRYAEPTWAEMVAADYEPPTGSCHNCAHAFDVKIGKTVYTLCVSERDKEGCGDVAVLHRPIDECFDWDEVE